MRFLRPCVRCGDDFRPTGKDNKICDNCNLRKKKSRGRPPKPFKRPCRSCNEIFIPNGKHSWMCNKCKKEVFKKRKLKNRVRQICKIMFEAGKNDVPDKDFLEYFKLNYNKYLK